MGYRRGGGQIRENEKTQNVLKKKCVYIDAWESYKGERAKGSIYNKV